MNFDSKSEVVVIDAKTMSQDPVAIIEIPSRVPYGFHSVFVSEVSEVAGLINDSASMCLESDSRI